MVKRTRMSLGHAVTLAENEPTLALAYRLINKRQFCFTRRAFASRHPTIRKALFGVGESGQEEGFQLHVIHFSP